MVEALTDNKNRTSAEIRNIFSKKGGNMAGSGIVSWIFNKKWYAHVDKSLISEDDLFTLSVDAGAEDLKTEGKNFELYCDPQDLENVKRALEKNNIKWEVAELTMLPSSLIKVTGAQAKQVLSLVETLEDHDDTQNVYANFDIPDDILEEIAQEMP